MRVKRSRPSMSISVSGPMMSRTSPPEEKLPASPVITTAWTPGALARSRNVSRNSAYESKVSGFLRSAPVSVMVAVASPTEQAKWALMPSRWAPACGHLTDLRRRVEAAHRGLADRVGLAGRRRPAPRAVLRHPFDLVALVGGG